MSSNYRALFKVRYLNSVFFVAVLAALFGCAADPVAPRVESGTFWISSQAELDDLAGVQTIHGSLFIEYHAYLANDDPVVDLSPLSKLESVSGSLRIDNIDGVTSLGALASLKKVGSNFFIGHNRNIISLAPLRGVEDFGIAFFVQDNDRLKNLDGLQNLDYETGISLQIALNDSLVSLYGLHNLVSFNPRQSRAIDISGNQQLESLAGLEQLREVGQLRIRDNPVLSDIGALNELRSAYEIALNNCPRLMSLPAFSVLDTCDTLILIDLPLLNLDVFADSFVEKITIGSMPYTNFEGMFTFTALSRLSISAMPDLEDFVGFESLQEIGYLLIDNNPALSNCRGLDSLESAAYIRVQGSPSLCDSTIVDWVNSIADTEEVVIYGNRECSR